MVRNEKTRKFIIEKTVPIFNKKGFVGTYLSDITEATKMTKGSIYGNFKDKSEVAPEAFIYNYNAQTGPLYNALKKQKILWINYWLLSFILNLLTKPYLTMVAALF